MNLSQALLTVYESSITDEEKSILIDEIYERCIDAFILECELEYLDKISNLGIMESTNEDIADEDYNYLRCKIYESVDAGDISTEFAEFVLDVITEAEKDHKAHMSQKKIAAKRMGVDYKDLPNKKYATDKDGNLKNPEEARKADLKYKYKDKLIKKGKNSIGTEGNVWGVNNKLIDTKDSKSTIKMLEYLKKKGNDGDEESIKKYQQVFKMFCNKYGIDENSGLYIAYNPRKVFKGKMIVSEWREGKGKNAENTQSDTGHALPSGYSLIHKSPTDGIKELKPTRMTNHHLGPGKSGVNGQYRLTGRVYFTLMKAGDELSEKHTSYHYTLNKINGKLGGHVYQLAEPVKEFFVDGENPNSRGLDKVSLEKLVGKAVYVKTEKPLKVKQLK